MPIGVDALSGLPGIGRSTAGAIAAIAQEQHAPILDGNVKRVLARFHAVRGYPATSATAKRLWYHAEVHTPRARTAAYTQAIMDLGATVCQRSKPACLTEPQRCPLVSRCDAYATNSVARYPERKRATAKPERSASMWLFHTSDGLCLLEQRPPQGIWGGLWTPPERDVDTTQAGVCAELGIAEADIVESRAAEPFRHTFSHYHLHLHPHFVRLGRAPQQTADADRRLWYDTKSGTPALGLAKPAVTLLAQLPEGSTPMTETHERSVFCRKYQQDLPGLAAPPMPGPKGQELFETISARAWGEWQELQTMLINEKHLNLRDAQARKYLSEQREKFFDNAPVDRAEGFVPQESKD